MSITDDKKNTESTSTETSASVATEDVGNTNSGVTLELKGDAIKNSVDNNSSKDQGEQKTFDPTKTAEKIRQLSEENKNWRLTQKENKQALEETKAKLARLEKNTQERLLNAEIKVMAQKYKLRDVEDAKRLADLSGVTVKEDGDVFGVGHALEKLKEAKPYLFDSGTTSAGFSPSLSTSTPAVDIRGMSKNEYKIAKAKLLGRR